MKNEIILPVGGMHCASCEVLVERKLLKIDGICYVKASVGKNNVKIEYDGESLDIKRLNKHFKKDGYIFGKEPSEKIAVSKKKNTLMILGLALLLIIGFTLISRTGLTGLVSVSAASSLPTFFFFGLLAGVSTCAALVGGIILSVSKQWANLHSKDKTFVQRAQPHFLFNLGRLISYTLFGVILGMIGSRLQLSLSFYSIIIFAVSVMMIFLGLQLLGVRSFQRFQLRLPRFITGRITDETQFSGKAMPLLMGALTFLLPCGFTITAQGLALLSGNAIQGGLIMLFFALGTLAPLLAIGLSSVRFYEKPKWAATFSKVAGILVLFFALYNFNAQLNVLGVPSFSDIQIWPAQASDQVVDNDLPPVVNGQQIVKTDASAYGYKPRNIKIRAGIPVKWEITDTGTSGCTNAIISRSLFDGEISLTPGQTSIKEFTPTEPGVFKYSCWMGMVSGTFEVVESDGSPIDLNSGNYVNEAPVGAPSSGSCGGSCGGGCGGGCGSPGCTAR